jgi:ribosomal protein L29
MILRIIEGAIKNACDSHGLEFDPYFARSVAKRAAGTLSAEMSAVLAAKPSEKLGVATNLVSSRRAARTWSSASPVRGSKLVMGQSSGRSQNTKVAPLRQLEKHLFSQMRAVKDSGNVEKANAFIEILRKIAELKT